MKKRIFLLSLKGTTVMLIAMLIMSGCLAYGVGDNYKRIKYGVPRGVFLGEVALEKMLEDEVEDYLLSLNESLFLRPRNAYLDFASGQILAETYGQKIDIRATLAMIMNSEPYTTHDPLYITLDPEIIGDVYRNIQKRIGSYMTGFGGGNRGENIRLAAYYINNYPLAPGEVFSFNGATMPRTAEKGYKMAPIIVGGAVIPGYGGGVCQVSTTLYNAVKRAGLQIVERFPHSRPVGYVPKGMDATVSDYLDFKFRNNTDKFILIKASAWGYRLVVEIWQ